MKKYIRVSARFFWGGGGDAPQHIFLGPPPLLWAFTSLTFTLTSMYQLHFTFAIALLLITSAFALTFVQFTGTITFVVTSFAITLTSMYQFTVTINFAVTAITFSLPPWYQLHFKFTIAFLSLSYAFALTSWSIHCHDHFFIHITLICAHVYITWQSYHRFFVPIARNCGARLPARKLTISITFLFKLKCQSPLLTN